jgi:hypothetical protein
LDGEEELYHPDRDERHDPVPSKPKPAPVIPPVRDITASVFGALGLPYTPDGNNLVPIQMPTAGTIKIVDEARFTFGKKDPLEFRDVPSSNGRMAVFAVSKGGVDRAIILVLPETAAPDDVLVIISANIEQNRPFYAKLGSGHPLSPNVVLFYLNSHLKDNHMWAAQMLASSKKMAVVYICRSLASKGSSELGPVGTDGAFFRTCLAQMAALTNDSFSFGSVSAMSFSLGIFDFNVFLAAVAKHVPVTRIINLDPERATHATRVKGAVVVEFLSGLTGFAPGFELVNEPRWVNEPLFLVKKATMKTKQDRLSYFHDRCVANYLLRLALQKT